jgi:hypothetical protein
LPVTLLGIGAGELREKLDVPCGGSRLFGNLLGPQISGDPTKFMHVNVYPVELDQEVCFNIIPDSISI